MNRSYWVATTTKINNKFHTIRGKFVFKPQKRKIVFARRRAPSTTQKYSLVTHIHCTLSCAHTRSSYLSTLGAQWGRSATRFIRVVHTRHIVLYIRMAVVVCLAFVPLEMAFRVHAPINLFTTRHFQTNPFTHFSSDKIKTITIAKPKPNTFYRTKWNEKCQKLPQSKHKTSLEAAMVPVNSFDFQSNKYWWAVRLVSNKIDKFSSPSVDS